MNSASSQTYWRKIMITEACILIGGAVGAIAGAAVSNTEWGQELNNTLEDSFGMLEHDDTDLLTDDTTE